MANDNQIAVQKRLIYAEDLFEPVDHKVFMVSVGGRSGGKTMAMYESLFRKRVELAPTIDPVHAAGACRCHECIHWKEPWLVDQTLGKCRLGKTAMTKPEHFCGYGVRREDHGK